MCGKWKLVARLSRASLIFFPNKNVSYQELYTSHIKKAVNMRATEFFLNNLNIHRRTEQYRLSCEDKINSKGCAKTLATFQHNKAPGNEVIPIEF